MHTNVVGVLGYSLVGTPSSSVAIAWSGSPQNNQCTVSLIDCGIPT